MRRFSELCRQYWFVALAGAALTTGSTRTLSCQTPGPAEPPAKTEQAPMQKRDPYWVTHSKELLVDFGNLKRFETDNAALSAPEADEKRVVFMGDSITQGWRLDESFPGKGYLNRGISGQTTPQMLVRFRQDVVDIHPRVVVILAGTNDLAGNTGPMTLKQTEENLASMADLAWANKIQVVLCSVTPASDFPWDPGLEPAPKIAQLNEWIRDFAARRNFVYVDYYSALKDANAGMPSNLSTDGVHPNATAYSMMAPLAEKGIKVALSAAQ